MTQTTRTEAPFQPGQPTAPDEVVLQQILELALSRGGDYADLFFQYRAAGTLLYEEGILKTATRGVSLGVGVRVQRGDATGYAYSESLTLEDMRAAARTAAQIAASGSALVPPLAVRAVPNRYPVELSTFEHPGTDKRRLLERADRAARAFDPRIQRVQVSLLEEDKEILIATSDGVIARDRQPLLRFGVTAIAEDGRLRQSGSSGGGGRLGLDDFLLPRRTPEHHGKEAARVAIAMLDAREAPAGELPVVLAPGDSGILLHEAVGHGLEADFNRKGTSNYTGRIGHAVASPLVTVVDDPTIARGRGSLNVDDEGQLPSKLVLIEDGVLRAYMHDRHSARHFATSSGNGRRESFRHAPMPRMTNTMMLGGPHDPEEILRSVRRGVYAKRFSGGQVDISNGDFVFSLTESYLIEEGRLTAPLKGVNLIGNGPEVLSRVDMLGSDLELSDGIWTCGKEGQSVPVGVGCPTTRIASITVGGTKA